MAIHTQDRGAGTGICDQYLDEAVNSSGLRVLMGGGRKWFLPEGTPGSQRSAKSDYVLPDDLVTAWHVAAEALDPMRDLAPAGERTGADEGLRVQRRKRAGNTEQQARAGRSFEQ